MRETYFKEISSQESEIIGGNVDVIVTVKKASFSYELAFNIKGEVVVLCDRCLDSLKVVLDVTPFLVVKMGESYQEVNEELVVIPEKEGVINIAWYLYEYMVLALPMQRVHKKGKCNKDMEQTLASYSLLKDKAKQEDIDPRWEALKKLKNNND